MTLAAMIELPQLDGRSVLTHSRLQCAKTCKRKAYLQYEIGLRRKVAAKPLRMGAAVHRGIELWRKGMEPADAALAAAADYEEMPRWATDDETVNEWMVEREIVVRLIMGYCWRWADDGLQVLATEASFGCPIINPETGKRSRTFTLAGKIDGIIKMPDGRTLVSELKTCGEDLSPDANYWKRLLIDPQIPTYIVGAGALGHDVSGVLYDVIRKPSIRPKIIDRKTGERETPEQFGERFNEDIAQRPDFYFARREFARTQNEMDEYAQELWDQAKDHAEMRRTGRWYRNSGSCLMFGVCAYFDICAGHYDVAENGAPDGFEIVNNVHPELNGDDE